MYCFVLHIGIYPYCTNSKKTHTSCACFQHAHTRSGRMFGRVCMLKASSGLVCLFPICKIFIYISIYCGWLKFRGVPIFVVLWRVQSTNSKTHEMVTFYMNYERKHWPRILNPTNVSFLFNPRKLVLTKIKPSTV